MRFTLKVLLACLFLSGLTMKVSDAKEQKPDPDSLVDLAPITEAYPESGVLLGQGWNLVASQKTPGVCVVGGETQIPGNGATMNYSYLLDKEQLLDSMSISATAAFRGLIGGGSLSTSFAQTLNVNTNKTNILATVVADKGGWQYTPITSGNDKLSRTIYLTPEAKKLASTDIGAFTKLCGHGYVASRRDGGRLDIVFALSTKQREKTEKLSLDASGHYGPVSGSISLNKSHQDIIGEADTAIRQLQQGGDMIMVTTADEALEKIKKFATFESLKSHPYQIAIFPYHLLPDFPKSAKPVSILKIRSYLAQSLRLAEISKMYSDAAMYPMNYYFSFQAESNVEIRSKDLMAVARAASSASICLDKFVAWCAESGGTETGECYLGDVLRNAAFKKYCDVLSDPSGPKDEGKDTTEAKEARAFNAKEQLLAIYLLIGLDKNDFDEFRNQKATAANITNITKIANLTLGGVNFKNPDHSSPYWFYMQILANAPLLRVRNSDNTNFLPGDQLKEARDLSSNSDYPSSAELVKAEPLDEKMADVFRRWVLNRRLYPLSQSFCDFSRSHPMCFETDELFNISKEVTLYRGSDRGFEVTVKPIPPIPAPPRKVEPPRRRDPCGGMDLLMPRHECH